MPGSSNSCTYISRTFCHNSGANTRHTKSKIFFCDSELLSTHGHLPLLLGGPHQPVPPASGGGADPLDGRRECYSKGKPDFKGCSENGVACQSIISLGTQETSLFLKITAPYSPGIDHIVLLVSWCLTGVGVAQGCHCPPRSMSSQVSWSTLRHNTQ
jgi:hypothetical protein